MLWLFESPIPSLVIGVMLIGTLVVLYTQSGQSLFLKLTALAVALTIGGLVAQTMIVTDRESVNDTLAAIAQSLELGDTAAVVGAIDPQQKAMRSHVEMLLSRAKIRKAQITSSEVTLNPRPQSPTAQVDVFLKVSGSVGGLGSTEDYPLRFVVDFTQEPNGRWLITHYDRVDLLKKTPMGELQH